MIEDTLQAKILLASRSASPISGLGQPSRCEGKETDGEAVWRARGWGEREVG